MHKTLIRASSVVAITLLVLPIVSFSLASTIGENPSFPARTQKTIFFAPFDAPYVSGDFEDRLRDLLASISLKGERSELGTSSYSEYRSGLVAATFQDYILSQEGKSILNEGRSWLVSQNQKISSGYQQYRDFYIKVVNAFSSGKREAARNLIIELFSSVPVFKYVNAEQSLRVLEGEPLRKRFRSIAGLTSNATDEYLFYPLPQDLVEQRNDGRFVPIRLRSPADNGAILGEAATVEVLIPGADRLMEKLAGWPAPNSVFLPERLVFGRNFKYYKDQSQAPLLRPDALVFAMPDGLFQIYSAGSVGQPTLFLIAVQLEARGE